MQKLKSELKSFLNTFNFLLVFLTFAFLFLTSPKVYAADFKTDYQVEYDLSRFQETLTAKVKFNIKITNLRGDVYVNKFTIGFPKSFTISALELSDDNGAIVPKVMTDEENTKVEMEFSAPNVGRDSVNNFYVNFDQSNLFQVNGRVWEVVLPVIENREGGSYKVVVNLPQDGKRISIAKPKPDSISGNQIVWDNPRQKTIYAVFGENQIYKAELSYHLKNTELIPIITEVAFPPDTLYQKIYLDSISPAPGSVYQDEDGNYLGKYLLKPLEKKTIVFRSYIQVFPAPREELTRVIRKAVSTQKNYLLGSQKYWQIDSLQSLDGLTSAEDIYNFTVNNLKYNYQKINSDNVRLGAEGALSRPSEAVCLEFTDLFVGASREKGILAREVEGYGFSFDPKLQPLSLVSDVLHAWPEYYDTKTGLWIPVDPTWENTSGIDYFSSFDLNHIVFAIHGKKSTYPLPAGMYKVDDSKDISIKAVVENATVRESLDVKDIKLATKISEDKNYQGKFVVKNNGNVYLWEIPVAVTGDNLRVNRGRTVIASLAPYEEKTIDFDYAVDKSNKENEAQVFISVFGKQVGNQKLTIVPEIYEIGAKVGIGSVSFLALIFIIKRIKTQLSRK